MTLLSNKKIALAIVTGLLGFFILFMPVITAAGVVAVPVIAIHELFSSIGDVLFGGSDFSNDVIVLINKYLELDTTKKLIKEVYEPCVKKEKDIPLHWLVIPNLLAGIEDDKLTAGMVKTQIELIKQSESDLNAYIDQLRKQEPWKKGFGSVSTTTIAGYINVYTNYLGQEDSIDVGNLKDEEFLYPLKKRAVVTSEFGDRIPVTLPSGQVVSGKHTGIDLAYPGGNATTCGVPIYAAMPGEVVANERTASNGGANWGSIRYKNLDIWYLHLRDPFPYDVGTKIKKGQFVGYIGETGLAAGCHLHFETHVDGKAINPRKFLDF